MLMVTIMIMMIRLWAQPSCFVKSSTWVIAALEYLVGDNDDEEGDDDEREKHQRNSQNNSIASVHRTGLHGKPDDDPATVDYDHNNWLW